MDLIEDFISKNNLIFAFLLVGLIIYFAEIISNKLTNGKIPSPAIAITLGLFFAYFGGAKGVSDIKLFSGVGQLGGAMFRDFAIVATAIGASLLVIKKAGFVGVISLFIGITISFFLGVFIALLFGVSDIKNLATIGAGACTYIVGPVTGAALGASSDIIALSIAAGVIKAIFVAIGTPILAKKIGLDNPQTAMIFGGIIGTNAGVMAGLAATDSKLVPYGAITATFYTGLGCLLCPSVFYLILELVI
jgi:malonate transporter MadM subunit